MSKHGEIHSLLGNKLEIKLPHEQGHTYWTPSRAFYHPAMGETCLIQDKRGDEQQKYYKGTIQEVRATDAGRPQLTVYWEDFGTTSHVACSEGVGPVLPWKKDVIARLKSEEVVVKEKKGTGYSLEFK